MPGLTYPADTAEAGLRIFLTWLGAHYARSATPSVSERSPSLLRAEVTVGRQWLLHVTLVDTLEAEATLPFEAARAAVEQRLDGDGLRIALFLPRGAKLPGEEPGLSQLAYDATESMRKPATRQDGRLEVRRPVNVRLRRTSTTGSVVTVLGGLSAHWAQFTNRVPGSFQLNSSELTRLPADEAERQALAETIVNAAQQPDVDEGLEIHTVEAWTALKFDGAAESRSVVIGTPNADTDEQSAVLRRNLRAALKRAIFPSDPKFHARALVVLGAATYAEEEKISWSLRGMDPTLYAGYEIVAVIADGLVKPLLQPARSTLPWDAPVT